MRKILFLLFGLFILASNCYAFSPGFLQAITQSAAAPTCSDGIQNGDETGVDCGGSCPACGSTPIALEQHKELLSTSNTSGTVTFDSSVTAGSLIVVTCALGNNTAPVFNTPTDSQLNQYYLAATYTTGNLRKVSQFYAYNVTGEAAVTVTVTTSNNPGWQFGIHIAEYSGIQTSSDPLDQTATGFGEGTSPQTFTTATTGALSQSNTLVIQAASSDGYRPSVTQGSDFISLANLNSGGDCAGISGYKIVSSTSGVAAHVNYEGTDYDNWIAVLATYKGL